MRKESNLTPISVGAGIRISREILGLTQRDLADMSGISLRQIRIVESDKVSPRMSTINKIAKALDMTPGKVAQFHKT